jgi:bile-salt sulfotransferase
MFHNKESTDFIKVYSHPRSGTHFLETFLGKNFYPEVDLSVSNVAWGHWSNRQIRQDQNKYGKLFGSHEFPSSVKGIYHPAVYIYRDPKAVAYSIWKTPNFVNPKLVGISFSEFLRIKVDWIGSPAFRCKPKFNIIQHWEKHVAGWLRLAKNNPLLLSIRYEDLLENPLQAFGIILNKFNNIVRFYPVEKVNLIEEPVGLLPNKAVKDSWKEVFTIEDLQFLKDALSSKFLKSLYL